MIGTTAEIFRKKTHEAVAAIFDDTYDCDWAWSAWSYGTMGEDDFSAVAENPDRVNEIANAALAKDAYQYADAMLAERGKRERQQNHKETKS